MRRILLAAVLSMLGTSLPASDKTMDGFISGLMRKMTLREKIGQLNLLPAGEIVTGAEINTEVSGSISAGDVGGVFNVKGTDKIRALQEIAVRKSRLGIPLIVGMDVIHGYETIFPVVLVGHGGRGTLGTHRRP